MIKYVVEGKAEDTETWFHIFNVGMEDDLEASSELAHQVCAGQKRPTRVVQILARFNPKTVAVAAEDEQ